MLLCLRKLQNYLGVLSQPADLKKLANFVSSQAAAIVAKNASRTKACLIRMTELVWHIREIIRQGTAIDVSDLVVDLHTVLISILFRRADIYMLYSIFSFSPRNPTLMI